MIAVVVGNEGMQSGPVPIALAHAGYEVREAVTEDEADRQVRGCGPTGCVVLLDAGVLGGASGNGKWSSFLSRHGEVTAVVVARGKPCAEARSMTEAPHCWLLVDPFDAAAVVAAVRRAVRRPPVPGGLPVREERAAS